MNPTNRTVPRFQVHLSNRHADASTVFGAFRKRKLVHEQRRVSIQPISNSPVFQFKISFVQWTFRLFHHYALLPPAMSGQTIRSFWCLVDGDATPFEIDVCTLHVVGVAKVSTAKNLRLAGKSNLNSLMSSKASSSLTPSSHFQNDPMANRVEREMT
jgi:hypothetical protein